MEKVAVTEDDLRLLEKRFGSAVRPMRSWNSDGTFELCRDDDMTLKFARKKQKNDPANSRQQQPGGRGDRLDEVGEAGSQKPTTP
jgi:hypothetical protein